MVGPWNAFVKGFRGPVVYLEDEGFTGNGRAGGKRPFSAAGCSPRNPLCAGAESPKPAPQRASGSPVQPCGLVCEVMACRIGHTGRGLVGLEVRGLVQAFALNPTFPGLDLGLCSRFPARPQDLYTVFRLTPRAR